MTISEFYILVSKDSSLSFLTEDEDFTTDLNFALKFKKLDDAIAFLKVDIDNKLNEDYSYMSSDTILDNEVKIKKVVTEIQDMSKGG